MSDLIKRLDEYIEYAESVKRFADVGFYEELKEKLMEFESHEKYFKDPEKPFREASKKMGW